MLKDKSDRKIRQYKLSKIIEKNPMITDNELALQLDVSVSTVRLDRALMGVPELRERIKSMAQNAMSKLQSLSPSEVIFLNLNRENMPSPFCEQLRIWPSISLTS